MNRELIHQLCQLRFPRKKLQLLPEPPPTLFTRHLHHHHILAVIRFLTALAQHTSLADAMSELEILDLPDTANATALDTELMDSTAEVCASANDFLRAEIRKTYPYMKTAALDGMMREVLSVIEKRIEERYVKTKSIDDILQETFWRRH